MSMEGFMRLFVILTLVGLGATELSKIERTLVANQLLNLLEKEEKIERQSSHLEEKEESSKGSIKWDNSLNRPLKVECNTEKGEALVRVRSKFSKKDGDRQFKWDCQDVTEGNIPLKECEWSKEVNKWNGPISYICPADKVMAGIKSKNHESKDDRKWKVKCCKAQDHITKSCRISKQLNSYRQEIDYAASRNHGGEPSVFVGIQSLENPKNDREWQVFECNFGAPKCPQAPQSDKKSRHTPDGHHSYNIILDLKKPTSGQEPPPPSPPKTTTYRVETTPNNDGHYILELEPFGDKEGENQRSTLSHLVQQNEASNSNSPPPTVGRNEKRPPRLLPVPPGTSKHPDLVPKQDKTAPNELQPGNRVIEIVPRFNPSEPSGKDKSPFSLQYKETIPKQSHERHIHIYRPQGDIPGKFTLHPNPYSDVPKIRYTEPRKPPQKTHYHMKLPQDTVKAPKELHYDVPIPGVNKGIGEHGAKYSIPLVTPKATGKGNAGDKTIDFLKELAKKYSLQQISMK